MKKNEIIDILQEVARLLTLKDENTFKIRAYENAARTLKSTPQEIDELIDQKLLPTLKGIGTTLAQQITELYQTNTLEFYESLKKEVPEGLVEINELPGIGPKKARHLFYDLGLHSLGELEYACTENRLLNLKGFGAKTQQNILNAIGFFHKNQSRFLYPVAYEKAQELVAWLTSHVPDCNVQLAGELRRTCETVSEIILLVSGADAEACWAALDGYPEAQIIKKIQDHHLQLKLKNGLLAELHWANAAEVAVSLWQFTGSGAHQEIVQERAKQKNSPFDPKKFPTEEALYKALDWPLVPPELREGVAEISWINNSQPLIDRGDLLGTFHMHTVASDGASGIKALVDKARQMGLTYIGVSDHSQSAFYAHGLKSDAIEKQHSEIDALNKAQNDVHILKGIESDILADGSLDYPEAILETFDFVIASVHSRFKMGRSEMTARLVSALKNPYTTMLGHLSGRLLLSREGYELDLEEILQVAAGEGKIIELNANPHRLDMDWHFLPRAKELGVKIAINPDAHRPDALEHIEYGINMARKGGLTRDDIVNCLSVEEVLKFL